MKTRFESLTLAAALALTTAAVQAGDLTIPNTFVPGTKALAEEVNANFAATQTAVNSKQDKLTAACAAGSSIRDISATGVPTCELDDNTSYTAGAGINITGDSISLAPDPVVSSITYSKPKTQRQLLAMNDFSCRDPSATSCPGANDAGRWKATSAGTLTLSARLAMPHNAVMSDVWCLFHDESTSNASFRVLERTITLAGPGWMVLTNSISTAATSTSVQTLQASSNPITGNWTTSGLTADNGSKAFFVEVTLPYDAAAMLALQGCYYDYTVTSP